MFGHLKSGEFIDLIEGLSLPPNRSAHLDCCADCRHTLESIHTLHENLEESGLSAGETFTGDVDWDTLRSSVRDHLLSRAVKRSSVVQRWTGQSLTPAAAWGLTAVLLAALMTVGGFWHYRAAHGGNQSDLVSRTALFIDSTYEDALFLDDPGVMEVEAMAWTQTDIFTILSELDSGEEDTLRELIALAVDDVLPLIEEN